MIIHRITSSSKQKRHFRQSNSHGNSRAHPYSSTAVKAGPSYKQCPKCDQLIPRNAVICSNCHSLCSRPGHVSLLKFDYIIIKTTIFLPFRVLARIDCEPHFELMVINNFTHINNNKLKLR